MKRNIVYAIIGVFFLAFIILAVTGGLDTGSIASIAVFWIIFAGIGLITGSSYKSANMKKLKKTIAVISLVFVLGSIYPSTVNAYFLIPAVIILFSFIFYNKNRMFFGMSFFLSFLGFISFTYVFLETSITFFETTIIGYFMWLSIVAVFNSLLSIVAYMIGSYKELGKPLGKTKEKLYVLKPPTSWFILPIIFLLLAALGAYASISPDVDKGANGEWLFPLYTLGMLGLVFIAGRSLNNISIDKSSIVVKGVLFPRKNVIKTKDIKSVVTKTASIGYGYNTVLLEVQTKKEIKTIDIRTNYNYRDTVSFMQVAKNVLGAKFKKSN